MGQLCNLLSYCRRLLHRYSMFQRGFRSFYLINYVILLLINMDATNPTDQDPQKVEPKEAEGSPSKKDPSTQDSNQNEIEEES